MRFSLNWLKEWVNITVAPQELASKLTLSGLEVEALTPSSEADKDIYIDIDFTPNRGDCLSIQGLAREISAKNHALFNSVYDFKKIAELDKTKVQSDMIFPITITDSAKDLCPLYLGRVIQNINLSAKTPDWLKIKLEKAEIKAIHPVVDILNYVMIELGQPMHAFDLEKLQGEIKIRLAENQEKIKLLDGKEVALSSKTLVIADNRHAVAIAGIMGGLESSVTEKTANLFLESAWFTPDAIAGRARQYGLHTDASYRFERGVDYQLPQQAMLLATDLILSICGGKPGDVIHSQTSALPVECTKIVLRFARVNQILGVDFDSKLIEQILTRLGCLCVLDKNQAQWEVTIPSFRYDLKLEIDLIEEVARIYGYENIPPNHTSSTQVADKIELGLTLPRLKQHLVGLGYREVITYSFVPPHLEALLNPGIKGISLANPISQEMSMMRTSLLPGLIQTLQFNLARQVSNLAIFEAGLCFYYEGAELIQNNRLAGLVYGKRYEENWADSKDPVDFYDVKGHIETILKLKKENFQAIEWRPSSHSRFHPGQSADIFHKGKLIGWVGALAPSLLAKLDITEPVYFFGLKLDAFLSTPRILFNRISAFPSTRRDLAFIVPDDISAQHILDEIKSINSVLIQETFIFDLYRGKNIAPGKKSLAVGIVFQHPARTLVDTEVEDITTTIIKNLKNKFGIMLRD